MPTTTYETLERERDLYRNKVNRLEEAHRLALADRDKYRAEALRMEKERDRLYERILEVDVKVKDLKEELERRKAQVNEYMTALRDARRAKQDAESARDRKALEILELKDKIARLEDREADRGADRKFDHDW